MKYEYEYKYEVITCPPEFYLEAETELPFGSGEYEIETDQEGEYV